MADTQNSTRNVAGKQQNAGLPLALNFAELQARNMATMAEANNILMQTVEAIWENGTQLFQSESEQARESVANLRPGNTPSAVAADLFDQWHRNSEKTIGHLRTINDLVRECEWRLLGLFTHNLKTKAAE